MKYIIISPHLDDGTLSCADLIVKLIEDGHDVSVAVIFSAMPPAAELSEAAKQYHSLCFLGDNAGYVRQKEEIDACSIMGCKSIHLGFLEALYRKDTSGKYIYSKRSDLIHIASQDNEIVNELLRILPVFLDSYDRIIAPLALGNHVDHLIVRKVLTSIESLLGKLLFYEDVPYIFFDNGKIPKYKIQDMEPVLFNIKRKHIQHKLDAIMCYHSQIHTMWKSEEEMKREIEEHMQCDRGKWQFRLWSLVTD